MEGLIEEYGKIINDGTQLASDKFWQLEKRIRKDRKHPGVVIEVRRSDAMDHIIARYIKQNLFVISTLSIELLAGACYVSNAKISKFCRALGSRL